MKKKFRVNKENDINILKNRIKQIEDEIQKQNDYDYQRAMKECKLKFITIGFMYIFHFPLVPGYKCISLSEIYLIII